MVNQSSASSSISTSSTSVEIAKNHSGVLKRTQLIIVNTSAAATLTITKGDTAAIAGAGIVLPPNGVYAESTDGGYLCWQGAIQAVSNVAGSVSIVESFIGG